MKLKLVPVGLYDFVMEAIAEGGPHYLLLDPDLLPGSVVEYLRDRGEGVEWRPSDREK